jgi:hypothetical protein
MAKSIRVNTSKAQRKIKATENAVTQGSAKGARAVAEELASRIRVDAPVDTGALQRSVEVVGDRVVVGGGPVDYASFVERREHFIAHNVDAMSAEAANIVEDEVRRRLP